MKQGRTVSCSSSAAKEDGEVDDSRGISPITALVLGRLTLIGGSSQEEAGIANSKKNEK